MNVSYYQYKLKEFKKLGLLYTFKSLALFFLRRIAGWINRNRLVVEVRYGFFPRIRKYFLFYQAQSGLLELPKSRLIQKVREFWYLNEPGCFNLDSEFISRKEIYTYGGPNPFFKCPICQKSEWLSRVKQRNLFISHSCPEAEKCKILCSRQGNELWTHFHQNFDFSLGINPNLPAPKGLLILPKDKNPLSSTYHRFLSPGAFQLMHVLRRRLAYTCQVDLMDKPFNINWRNYDFVFTVNIGRNQKFTRPNIPLILYSHDFWDRNCNYQWVIDWIKPDVLLTPYPTQWREYFKIPSTTKIVFYPFFESTFFIRPNLENKKLIYW
jgi:hypothetical protein